MSVKATMTTTVTVAAAMTGVAAGLVVDLADLIVMVMAAGTGLEDQERAVGLVEADLVELTPST